MMNEAKRQENYIVIDWIPCNKQRTTRLKDLMKSEKSCSRVVRCKKITDSSDIA